MVLEKGEWKSVLKACGEQSVTLAGTVEMQQWCVGNWDTLLLVSGRINQCPVEAVHSVHCPTVMSLCLTTGCCTASRFHQELIGV